ncbi:MAG TPA: lysophospholipid acyltransferase family protein, partial [Bacilli bacterium]|nr:lysophospholipid acyltransferase family protein [Bacilli bacterium]
MSAVYPRRVNFIAAKKFFYERPLGSILRLARAIPKALLEPDLTSTMTSLRTLRKGAILSLFPEGQITLSGEFLTPSFSVAKLLKKAAVPVYIVKHINPYLVNPPWNKKSYRGRITTEVYELYTAEQLATLTEQEIYDEVYKALHHNPFVENKVKRQKYRVKELTDIDLILYECPVCKDETLSYRKKTIFCTSCDYERTLDPYWQFGDTNFYELYLAQEQTMENKMKQDKNFSLKSFVTLESFRGDEIVTVGHGTFKMTLDAYYFSGEIDGYTTELKFLPQHVPSLPSDTGQNAQIYQNGQLYQFVFSDPKLPVKFRMFSEINYRLKGYK